MAWREDIAGGLGWNGRSAVRSSCNGFAVMNVGQNGTCVNAQVKLRVSCAPVNLGIGFTSSCVRDISKDVLTPIAEKECKITWGGVWPKDYNIT